MSKFAWIVIGGALLVSAFPASAGEAKKRVLLLWQSPDGHPKDTHEYELGQKILKRELDKFKTIDTVLVKADDPWKEGPELLAKADGVVMFVSEGAKWVNSDPKRLAAFQECAKRKAGLSVLHWGMGSKDAKNIEPFVDLFGGCHGGPNRKYDVLKTEALIIAKERHAIQSGLVSFTVRDEFYYSLKMPKKDIQPVMHIEIGGIYHPVAWAYSRPDGGRSYGFSGLHFHENWQLPEYRRFVTQGVLWTLNVPIPKDGIAVK